MADPRRHRYVGAAGVRVRLMGREELEMRINGWQILPRFKTQICWRGRSKGLIMMGREERGRNDSQNMLQQE
jgi:hypothetical protein